MTGRIKKQNTTNQIQRIGFIKCGEKIKNKNGNEIPTSLDYFKASGDYSEHFNKAHGEKPRIIKIIFISDKIDEVCNERFEIWQGKKKFGYGDGETFFVWDHTKGKAGEYVERKPEDVEKFLTEVENYVNKGKNYKAEWKLTLTLRFLIPKIGGVLGVWELTTRGAESSIPGIVTMFDKVIDAGGTVMKTIFDLRVEMVKSVKPDDRRQYPVISLVPNMSRENLEEMKGLMSKDVMLPLMVTENTLEEIKVKPEQSEQPEQPDIEADYIINTNNDLKSIENQYRMCKDFPHINSVLFEARKLRQSGGLSEDDWFKAEIIRKEVVETLKEKL